MFERLWPKPEPAAGPGMETIGGGMESAPSAEQSTAPPSSATSADAAYAEAFAKPYPDFSIPHPHARLEPLYRFLAKWLIRIIYRPCYRGFEQIPAEGPGIIIANHVAYLDGLFINAGSPRPVRFVIDKVIYEWPGVHYFMQLNRAIPIYPKKEIVEAALEEISNALKNGELVCIFPEGRLTYTGFLGRFKQGIEHIIRRDPVPIYPIGIHGLWGSMFSRKYLRARERPWLRKLPDVRLVMGAPIAPDHADLNFLQREVMRLMNEARALERRACEFERR